MYLLKLKKNILTVLIIVCLLVVLASAGSPLKAKSISPSSNKDDKVKVEIPKVLSELFEIEFLGAFRVYTKEGESSSNFAVGTIAFNPDNDSLFLAGHDHHDAVAEFKIPKLFNYTKKIRDLPNATVIQPYSRILNKNHIGNTTDRITGLLYYEGSLLVNSEIWYDGSGKNKDNQMVVKEAGHLKDSDYKGMLQLNGAAKAAGYMSYIPEQLHSKFGGKYLTGWASNNSITSRYSQGPSLYVFDPSDSIQATVSSLAIDANPKMVFPFKKGMFMVEDSDKYNNTISPIWGPIANARYGFIVPNTKWFLVLGFHGGINGGIGYKITQDNGRRCNGTCTRKAKDIYNYFWVFNIDDILNAEQPYLIQPFSYGKWNHPYDKNGKHKVIGATFDRNTNRLFISLSNAGSIGKYDRSPLILTYKITSK